MPKDLQLVSIGRGEGSVVFPERSAGHPVGALRQNPAGYHAGQEQHHRDDSGRQPSVDPSQEVPRQHGTEDRGQGVGQVIKGREQSTDLHSRDARSLSIDCRRMDLRALEASQPRDSPVPFSDIKHRAMNCKWL